jgi:hypothetical protein
MLEVENGGQLSKLIWEGQMEHIPCQGEALTLDTEDEPSDIDFYRELRVESVLHVPREQKILIYTSEDTAGWFPEIEETGPSLTLTL